MNDAVGGRRDGGGRRLRMCRLVKLIAGVSHKQTLASAAATADQWYHLL